MLKWPPDQAFKADVNLILMALDANAAMIKAIFGSADEAGDQPKPTGKQNGASVNQWLAFSRKHNSRYHGRKRGRRPVAPAKAKGRRGGS